MRAALQAIEQRLEARAMPLSGVQDLKSGVDELRLRLWAILSASNNPDPASTLERFRLRRAIEILDSINIDIASGALRTGHKEIPMLVERAERLIAVLRATAAKS